jgi:hypothetical protein
LPILHSTVRLRFIGALRHGSFRTREILSRDSHSRMLGRNRPGATTRLEKACDLWGSWFKSYLKRTMRDKSWKEIGETCTGGTTSLWALFSA